MSNKVGYTSSSNIYRSSAPSLAEGEEVSDLVDVSGNKKITLATALDKTNDSITNYSAPWNCTIVDLATDADVVVTASPAVLGGFRVDTVMSAHVALIKDSATTVITIAASTAANYNENYGDGITMATNITVESDNSGTGKVAVFWRAL